MGIFKRDASKPKVTDRFGFDLFLYDDGTVERLGKEGGTYPLAGVSARVEAGEALQKRVTATRVATMGVFALAAKKKSGGEVYLTVEGPEFFWTLEVDRKKQKDAREFAAKVNQAARSVA
jgi:hypothetical protein